MTPPSLIAPPRWTEEELERERLKAIEVFRKQRMEEPLEAYLQVFEDYRDKVEELLESTVDLSQLDDKALSILTNPGLLEAFRYLSGPPISLDDLKVLAEVERLSSRALRADPAKVKRVLETVRLGLDRQRFPWVAEDREPTEAERHAAVIASTALMATQRVATNRRNEGKAAQEALVKKALRDHGFIEIPGRPISNLAGAPKPGEFCSESMFGTRKADIPVGLHDRRALPIECKVSNSATNSIKRLNNDAAVKAEIWRKDFGELNVVPTAVLSGVYKLSHLVEAQRRGLTLFWAHELNPMLDFIDRTKPGGPGPGSVRSTIIVTPSPSGGAAATHPALPSQSHSVTAPLPPPPAANPVLLPPPDPKTPKK